MLISIAYAQNAQNILSSRNYVYGVRPLYIPMLLGDGIQIYKTSVDSITWNSVKYTDTSSMLLPYAKISLIPTNNNQLTNGSGYLVKGNTDTLYKSITWFPTWAQVTSKPTFATVATSGSYNDLSNKPTIPSSQVNSDWNSSSGVSQILNKPTLVQQYGTSYTKEFNTKVSTNTGTNEYTVSISSASFSSIVSVQATGYYNGATSVTQPIVSIKSYSTTSVVLVIAESANTNVLIGGTIEGLTDFLKVGEVFITVKGN